MNNGGNWGNQGATGGNWTREPRAPVEPQEPPKLEPGEFIDPAAFHEWRNRLKSLPDADAIKAEMALVYGASKAGLIKADEALKLTNMLSAQLKAYVDTVIEEKLRRMKGQ